MHQHHHSSNHHHHFTRPTHPTQHQQLKPNHHHQQNIIYPYQPGSSSLLPSHSHLFNTLLQLDPTRPCTTQLSRTSSSSTGPDDYFQHQPTSQSRASTNPLDSLYHPISNQSQPNPPSTQVETHPMRSTQSSRSAGTRWRLGNSPIGHRLARSSTRHLEELGPSVW